jgi:hypothetical protein
VKRGQLKILCIVGLGGWLAWSATGPTRLYVGDACLEYDQHRLSAFGDELLSPQLRPTFMVPFTTQGRADSTSTVDLLVTIDQDKGFRELLIDGRYAALLSKCDRKLSDFGLYVSRDNGSRECTGTTRTAIFEPADKKSRHAAILIACSDDPAVPNCRLSSYIVGDWQIDAWFPRDLLFDWQRVNDTVTNFFETRFVPCGETR